MSALAPCDHLSLTAQESTIIALMAAGLSNIGISRRMCVSVKTVESHVSSIFAKLDLTGEFDVNRRVTAVLIWLRSGRS